jgi:RimJ/RimL family protein N-acetyltransferase
MQSVIVETTRLVLRPPVPEDARLIFDLYAQDDEVTRYLTWLPHQRLSDTEAFINARIAEWDSCSRCSWVITGRGNQAIHGMISLRRLTPFRACIAYVLARASWGQGYATEAGQVK